MIALNDTPLERPMKDCREEFMTRSECALLENSFKKEMERQAEDLKNFRNQLAKLFGGGLAIATLILSMLQLIIR